MKNNDFEKMVKEYRAKAPYYNNGRRVVVLSEHSAKGKQVLQSASLWDGYTLNQVYDRYSNEKERAYNDAWQMYCNDDGAESFSICSHCSNFFTISWIKKGAVIFLTHRTEYVVICEDFFEK